MKKYSVSGMSCAACSARVEKAVSSVGGVESCSVNLLTNSLIVQGNAKAEDVIAAVEAAGYAVSLGVSRETANEKNTKETEIQKLKRQLVLSAVLLVLLMYLSMGHVMWGFPLPLIMVKNPMTIGFIQMILAAFVMLINKKFFISGAKAVLKRSPNMDTLVAMGSFASFAYSVYVLITMSGTHDLHELYFESAAMILTLITVGKMLEARAKGKTTSALEGLMKLAPQTATVLRNGKEEIIPIEEVNKDDIFIVKPGEQIPVDGIVTEGHSAVNESALTGESIPADKEIGSNVSSGTLNESGILKCRATRVGEDTTLSQIIKMVSDASATKAPIAKIADKVSGVFVPVVIGIAVLTLLVWLIIGKTFGFAIARAISVLVISCPCALGLATPVAIMVGTGVGAKNGILFKTAVSLEQTGKTQIVALDKTGTVTEGNPTVIDVIPAKGYDSNTILNLAATLEKNSEHPLAKAVIKKATENKMELQEVSDFTVLPGNGLVAKLNGEELCGGNLKFAESKAEIDEEMQKTAEKLSEEGKTPLFFVKNSELLGVIAVSDVIKEDSAEAIAELHKMGIRVVMLTGDNAKSAKAIADKVGIDEVFAGVLPGEKESVILSLKKSGKVAMVGDGINDAPALTSADTGIAIGAGTDIAIDAADLVLIKSRLSDVPAAIKLSRATLRNIRENLFWAFIYNVIGIPLAAGVWYFTLGWKLNPMFGAAAMSLSSVCVVSNALRLNFIKIKSKTNKKEEAKTMEKSMKIEGMMCGHCEARVKKCLEETPGVLEAIVNHKKNSAVVKLSSEVSDKTLKAVVEAQGYTVKEVK